MANVDVKKTTRETKKDERTADAEGQRRSRDQGALARPREWPGLSPFDFWGRGASPFEMTRRLSGEMDRAFMDWRGGLWGEGWGWAPAIETFERGGRYVVRAELPGIKQEDVKVELTDDGLFIEGERKHESKEEREGFFRSERRYGKFARQIPLPHEIVNGEQAKAEFKDGVLEVSLPLPANAAARRRQVPIQAAGAGSNPAPSKGETSGR